MTEQEALKDSIDHWERMILYAKKKDAENADCNYFNRMGGMELDIGESPYGEFCALCEYVDNMKSSDCKPCPLYKAGNGCNKYNSHWAKATKSLTWNDFIFHAQNLLNLLKSLYIGYSI